ncbi:hypothetical protein [Iningainema tapete]|uniref:Uncharacterized protein n=1 Tax=Iningainema tapete BLCC-T55 TaxID=2748662 RepID=A0A8J6XIK8_9CYAN|nr:hypothetical protein [Iningainema tapete]MBD2770887.1 hypothetical protein [Iningainema tapete BLCC-T55]
MIDLAKSSQLSLSDLFTRSLACAAISPGLRSILVFDTTSERLRLAAQNLAQMLKFVNGKKVTLVTLGTYEAEDDLWGSWALGGSDKQSVQWKPGLLTGDENNSTLRLVVIPDLAKLSLAAARACVVLMGADVAHLERHGQQAQWQPNLCWLAGCATSQVGMVSPHLLDRFALRLMGQVPTNIDKVASIREWIDDSLGKQIKLKPLPRNISQHLKKALQIHPKITPQATTRILDYIAWKCTVLVGKLL